MTPESMLNGNSEVLNTADVSSRSHVEPSPRVGAVIVLYHPDGALLGGLLDALGGVVSKVVLVDNSPEPLGQDALEPSFDYLHYPDNIGIAAAHNRGLESLLASGCDFGLLLDQDSEISPGLVSELAYLLAEAEVPDGSLLAVGPQVRCAYSGELMRPRIQKARFETSELVGMPQLIASGMMIDLSALAVVGLKDEALFIDGVDHEWCWRARAHGFQVAVAKSVEMVHRLGERRRAVAGLNYRVGSPVRLYYQFRNVLLLSRRGYVPTYWKVRQLAAMPIRFVLNGLLEEPRFSRLKFMMLGACHGLLGRTGKLR